MELGNEKLRKGADYGSALPLEAFFEDAQACSPPEFESHHGSGFLLLTATKLTSPKDSYSTDVQLLSDEESTVDVSVARSSALRREEELAAIGPDEGLTLVAPGVELN